MFHPIRIYFAAIALAFAAGNMAHGQSAVLFHQDTSLYVYGTVKDIETRDSLPGTDILIKKLPGDRVFRELHADEHGNYNFYLGKRSRYKITYAHKDMVAKHVEIDAESVPDTSWHGGMAMEVTISLLKPFKGSDDALFNEVIGRSRFNPATNLLEWDMDYTQRMKEKMDALRERDQ